jgi:hypothetical protein
MSKSQMTTAGGCMRAFTKASAPLLALSICHPALSNTTRSR